MSNSIDFYKGIFLHLIPVRVIVLWPTAVFPPPWFDLFNLGTFFSIVPENKHFHFHGTRQVEPLMLHCFEFLSEVDFYQLL